ncbi:hypothetical protein SERLADRAFT_416006 [Serpula lacrymans var. lacrymans S7.9]|uniref:POP1-domain-containing protein n=1 Tax=Serpula lacrymans var. lacrymans (strain S7.9) TaxID=578457 RepID=F8NY97_SERL9|nr:uncharacterized protein SERLADRAFT_416006 [Serpula lacrymans var. lacrymans S7.9]EGO23569.1 hypothetical protein SERLADRAFT_416006 [Serpula lacrymans var. lacrymans S7.9]
MASKRKNDQSDENTSRNRKKLRVADARTIAVQSAESAAGGTNAAAGPSSRAASQFDSMKGLPTVLDVEKFTEARAFEIDAMQTAMKNASASSTHRAWQMLPRHLRRRAASHDVRRVPLRLREKARAEMDPVRRKALGRSIPKRGKGKQISRTEAFLKRQRDKTWLETHIWHAKRMKMENLWGYRLAVQPTEKSFRPSHRAAVHGSILHDASYYSLIEIKGSEVIIKSLLEMCCDPQGPGIKRCMTGARVLDSHIYKPGRYPFDLIAPVTVLWMPVAAGDPIKPPKKTVLRSSSNSKKSKRQDKGEQGGPSTAQTPPSAGDRVVWVRCHPAVHDTIFTALQTSASLSLQSAKQQDQSKHYEIEIADLRGQVNVFEIMGPKSSQVIKGALSPANDDKREEFKKFWSSLTDLQTTASLPRGMVVGFKVLDPRLKFPPKNARPQSNESGLPTSSPDFSFPTSILAQSQIWDEEKRNGLKKPRYKKKDLDERRSKNLVPGQGLNPLRQDDRIPVLLIQRSIENTASSNSALHGWTLILPAGWAMPFLSSLIFTGTRVAGQRERKTQAFEAGTAYFPRDYPFTDFYEQFAEERADEEKGSWERKPPAKRPNFEKLQTKSPWKPDWDVVLGIANSSRSTSDMVPTQRENNAPAGDADRHVIPWLLRGADVPAMLDNAFKIFNHTAAVLAEINRLRAKRFLDALGPSTRAEDLWKGALVSVKLNMRRKGAPSDLAIIYRIEDAEAKQLMDVTTKKTRMIEHDPSTEIEISQATPSPASVIGYVTSGNFSLSRGHSFAIGAVPVAQFFNLQQQAQRLGNLDLLEG